GESVTAPRQSGAAARRGARYAQCSGRGGATRAADARGGAGARGERAVGHGTERAAGAAAVRARGAARRRGRPRAGPWRAPGREAARAELTSLEALQAAALSDRAGQAAEWLKDTGLAAHQRLAAALEVEPGWERAVETALGDYLEAVCVADLEALAATLTSLGAGSVTLMEGQAGAAAMAAAPAGPGGGAAAAPAPLSPVPPPDSLAEGGPPRRPPRAG